MTSPLRRSRADAMRLLIADRHGELYLDHYTYRALSEDGWTRSAIDTAANDLVEAGDAEVVTNGGALRVRLLGGAE